MKEVIVLPSFPFPPSVKPSYCRYISQSKCLLLKNTSVGITLKCIFEKGKQNQKIFFVLQLGNKSSFRFGICYFPVDGSFIHRHTSELCVTFPFQLLFMNSPQILQGDNKCLLSCGSNSFDHLIDTSRSGTKYLSLCFCS